MKCPVCDKQIENTIQKCPNCSFSDLRTEFINENELEMWRTYVVYPCRFAYQTSLAQVKELQRKFQNEITAEFTAIKKTQKKYQDALEKIDAEPARGAPQFPAPPKMEKIDGWNYNDPISHPNYSEGNCNGTKFSISEISVLMTNDKKTIVSFLVKKIAEKSWGTPTDSFAIRYRVKGQDGVIILNETKHIEGLMPGDVSREKIELTGIVPGKYSMDIVSYN